MERDMELIRELLFLLKDQEDNMSELKIPPKMDKQTVADHLKLMEQAGLVKNSITYASNVAFRICSQLTWEGYDFLDKIKDDTVWAKTKEVIKSKGLEIGKIPFSVLKDFIISIIKEKLM